MRGASVLRFLHHQSGFRFLSSEVSKSLVLKEYGIVEQVLKMTETEVPAASSLEEHQILLKLLAAPINPSDINTIEGRYPLRPELPATPGHEGVGVVEAVGAKVTRFRPGDRAVPIEHGQGTWRTHGVFDEKHWYRIPNDLPISTAATMVINPPTAIRLLEEFVKLQEGDTVVHTGGTSSTGKYILQVAKQMGLHSISVIRDRPDRSNAEKELQELGSSLVVTADELQGALKGWPHGKPKLGLDCIGGKDSFEVAKVLDKGATLVVYGGMANQPIQIPPGSLIFNNISVRGFWLTGGYAEMKEGWKSKERLVDRVVALFRQKAIRPVMVECMPLEDWEKALHLYRQRHTGKVLLTNYGEDVCL